MAAANPEADVSTGMTAATPKESIEIEDVAVEATETVDKPTKEVTENTEEIEAEIAEIADNDTNDASEKAIDELEDEVCPYIIYNHPDITSLLENISRKRKKERGEENNVRRKERNEEMKHFKNLLQHKH